METIHIFWMVLLVLLLVIEASTSALVSVWFVAGALAALITSIFIPGLVAVQATVFAFVSLAALLLLRPVAKKLVQNKHTPTNADTAIGKNAQVLANVAPGQFGRVKLEGQEWTACSNSFLQAGSWCRVDGIEGAKLVVSPIAIS